MNRLRNLFLFVVGTVGVAYEETTKAVKKQQDKLSKRMHRKAA
jgi:hypothetical protein